MTEPASMGSESDFVEIIAAIDVCDVEE